jgi:hypothetical protein
MIKIETNEVSREGAQQAINLSHKDPVRKQIAQGVDFYQKLCLKLYYTPNSIFLSAIKQENLKLYLDQYTLKDMNLINKTVGKFLYFKSITISARDPNSKTGFNQSNLVKRMEEAAATKLKVRTKKKRRGISTTNSITFLSKILLNSGASRRILA